MADLIPNESFELQQEQFHDNLAQVATATMMAQSLGVTLQRKHLIGISKGGVFSLSKRAEANQSLTKTKWIKIEQIGYPINNNLSSCFEAMQNILQSCFIPKTKLLFLIVGNGTQFSLYIGIQGGDANIIDFQDDVSNFTTISWTGVSCKSVEENSYEYNEIKQALNAGYSSVHALTGIPTLNLQNGYPGSVEYLMGGLRGGKMAYLVIAEPIEEQEIDNIINMCNEMQGQAESMKSFSFADSMQLGYNESLAKAHSETVSVADTIGTSKKDRKWIVGGLLGAGAAIGACLCFPPLAAFAPALGTLAAPLTNGGFGGVSLFSSLIPTKTKSRTTTKGKTDTETHTQGKSESYSKSLTRNLVNAHISYIVQQLQKQCARYDEGKAIGMWNVGCYLFTNTGSNTSPMQLKSLLSGKESAYEPIRIHDISHFCESADRHSYKAFITAPYFETMMKADDGEMVLYQHPLGQNYCGLTTLMTTRELSCLANFPLHSVPGIKVVDASHDFSLTEQHFSDTSGMINLGKLMWSGTSTEIEVKLPIDTLCRHALICGVNGSGKTNTVLGILNGFTKAQKPFFVIEPAKTEYVDWAIKYNNHIKDPKKKIKVFIPGCEKYTKYNYVPEKLRFNPFEVIQLPKSEMRVLSHIDRLKATFASAFPMQDILPVILEHFLYDLYTENNETMDTEIYRSKGFPTLSRINRQFIDDLMKNIGYARENTQNISAALRTRFKSLTYGWKGDLLNNDHLSGFSWDDLFGTPVIVNLSYAGDDQDRAFIMSLLLQFLYEYRIAESESGMISLDSNECRHLVVVEEAHRVMGRNDNPEAPQHKSGQMFSNFLSEVRAYGQGMMVVDQVPTRLIEDAIKNTNVKIIHKLVASDDSQVIAECVGLTPDQQKVIPKLSIGEAVLAGFNSANVLSNDSSDIYLAHINKMK